MEQNICKFIPYHRDVNAIRTINFILETKPQIYTQLKSESVYKMYYVFNGHGCLHTPAKRTPIEKGDLFFTFPGFPFAIESLEDLQYMYISFVGLRGNEILERLSINHANFFFRDACEVEVLWKNGIHTNLSVLDCMSESVLLYTFAYLGNRVLPKEEEEPKQSLTINRIQKYIDDHLNQQGFSLDLMSSQLSYNRKYLSHVFKKHFGVGIIEYLNTIRIQNACTLMEQGFTSITDIAYNCGYSDAQYFSKIFKAKMGIAPTQYVKNLQKKEH